MKSKSIRRVGADTYSSTKQLAILLCWNDDGVHCRDTTAVDGSEDGSLALIEMLLVKHQSVAGVDGLTRRFPISKP